jgi:hypothetical protein
MTPEQARNNPPENISPPAPINYELRVIVWETKEVVFKDKVQFSLKFHGLNVCLSEHE